MADVSYNFLFANLKLTPFSVDPYLFGADRTEQQCEGLCREVK